MLLDWPRFGCTPIIRRYVRGSRGRELEQISVVLAEKDAQSLAVVGQDGRLHARPLRERGSPGANAWDLRKDSRVGQRIEYVEVAKDRCECGIDERESLSRKERARTQLGFHASELLRERLTFRFVEICVDSRFEMPEIRQDRRRKFDPAAMSGAFDRVGRMQRAAGLHIFQILADDRALEENRLALFTQLHEQQRYLAERGYRTEPRRFVSQIDVASLEGDALFGQRDHRLCGRLRVTSSETLAYSRLTTHLAAFRHAHPGVVVELAIDNRILNLSRREADIALRPVRPKEGDLWGRRLAQVAWGLYAAPDYLAANGGPLASASALGSHASIGWEYGVTGIAAAEWLSQAVPHDAFVYRTNSLVNQLVAARSEIGLALLPCYLGDSDAGVVRAMAGPVPELEGELWIVAHADLKGTARVRAFFDVVGEGLSRERDLFEGRRESTVVPTKGRRR